MPWLSLPEYARSTGTPESTVRAAIRAGKLRAELEQRAPGDPRTVWRVWRDETATEPSSEHPQASTAPETDQPPSTLTEPPAFTLSLLALVEADRETITGQAEQIAALSERVGRAEAERDAARQTATDLARRLDELERERRRTWLDRLLGRR